MDGAGAADSRLGRRVVEAVPRSTPFASDLVTTCCLGFEAERLFEQGTAAVRVGRVGAHAVEALERELLGDVRVARDERRVGGLDNGELEVEPLGVGEEQLPVRPGGRHAGVAEPPLPEVERVRRGDAPDDAVHHPGAGPTGARVRVLEEGDVGARAAALVRVEQVVDGRVVLVDGLLDEPEPEERRVEVDVPGRVRSDAGDVVDPLKRHGRERYRQADE